MTASLNAAINQGSGFSAYKLVFGKDASTPLSNLICVPREKPEKKSIATQDPSSSLFQHAATRQKDLQSLQSKEFFDKTDEIEKAKARAIMFSQLRENRILSLTRSADSCSNNSHPMFPLRDAQDRGKLVYIFSDRIPKGKSQSLTTKWLGPARIDSVVSNILAIVTTQYREQRFGKPEKTQAFTIDRLYPFLSAHDTLCSADAPNQTDLVSTVHTPDYQPRDDEPQEDNIANSAEEDKDDDREDLLLTNDLAEAAHLLPDEFCEAARPDPQQQMNLTDQTHVPFSKIWNNIMEIDDPLLLNDIIPPGRHGEGWQGTSGTSFTYLTEDDTDEEDNNEGLNIPSYHDLCYHILLRHHQDLQQALLLNPGSPGQAEQLLLTNLALHHAPLRFPSLKTACIVLRGEDGTQHPIQIPLWGTSGSQPLGAHRACGAQKGSTGDRSTKKQHSNKTYNRK